MTRISDLFGAGTWQRAVAQLAERQNQLEAQFMAKLEAISQQLDTLAASLATAKIEITKDTDWLKAKIQELEENLAEAGVPAEEVAEILAKIDGINTQITGINPVPEV